MKKWMSSMEHSFFSVIIRMILAYLFIGMPSCFYFNFLKMKKPPPITAIPRAVTQRIQEDDWFVDFWGWMVASGGVWGSKLVFDAFDFPVTGIGTVGVGMTSFFVFDSSSIVSWSVLTRKIIYKNFISMTFLDFKLCINCVVKDQKVFKSNNHK